MRLSVIPFLTLNILSALALLSMTSFPDSISLLVTGHYSDGLRRDVSGTVTTSSERRLYLLLDTMIAGLAFLRRKSENGNSGMTTWRY